MPTSDAARRPRPAFASSCPTLLRPAVLRPATAPLYRPRTPPSRRRPTMTADPAYATPTAGPLRVSRAVVWLRDGDLRLHDHPGLSSATDHTSTALALLLIVTPATRPQTLLAAARLRAELRARGSALFVRAADDECAAVLAFCTAFAAECLHVCADVEYDARALVDRVSAALKLRSVAVHAWASDLRDWTSDPPLTRPPRDFPTFRAWRAARRAAPSDLDDAPPRIYPPPGDLSPELHADASREPSDAAASLQRLRDRADSAQSGPPEPPWQERFEPRASAERELTRATTPASDAANFGERALIDFLEAAERGRDGLPDLARSLGEVFRQGALSSRRMHELTIAHERANGRLWTPVYREAAKLVLGHLDAREFATLLARDDLKCGATVDGTHAPRFWRWDGFLVRYVEEGRHTPWAMQGRPPILLVHGFGASSQHFGKSVAILKERFHVFAVDLIGFGQSEKPPMQYTPAVWENMMWDFVRDVVQRPVYVAGNSIGGYISCAFGVDAYPTLCAGICLINSAGRLYDPPTGPDGKPVEEKPRRGAFGAAKYAVRKWRWLRLLAARALLKQLQGRIGTTLQKVYPKRGVDTDGELAREILRGSLDYGAVEVLCSGLITPTPRSIAALLRKYDGPLLVFNGLLDPLGDLPTRTDRLAEIYPDATVVRVDAGHCPHDEEPELFAEALADWVQTCETCHEERSDDDSSVGADATSPLTASSHGE